MDTKKQNYIHVPEIPKTPFNTPSQSKQNSRETTPTRKSEDDTENILIIKDDTKDTPDTI